MLTLVIEVIDVRWAGDLGDEPGGAVGPTNQTVPVWRAHLICSEKIKKSTRHRYDTRLFFLCVLVCFYMPRIWTSIIYIHSHCDANRLVRSQATLLGAPVQLLINVGSAHHLAM